MGFVVWVALALAPLAGCSVETAALPFASGDAALDGASEAAMTDARVDGDAAAMPDAPADTEAASDASGDADLPDDWWDPAFTRRQRLVFDNSAQSSPLRGFPVLVAMTDTRVDYDAMQASGEDLRFVDDDHATELPYEIERFVRGGRSFVWVYVTQIDAESTDDHIWLYYGNPAAGDAQRPAAVWANAYHAVYHLEGSSFPDSTGGHGPLSAFGDSVPLDGPIAGARHFDGVDDYLDTNCTHQLDSFTVTAWARAADVPQSTRISGPLMREQNYQLTWDHTVDAFRGAASSKAPDWQSTSFGTLEASVWIHLGASYQGSALRAWVDGRMSSRNDAVSGAPETNSNPARIARHAWRPDAETPYFEGDVDEVRISTVARGAYWMNAQQLSMTDAFVTFE